MAGRRELTRMVAHIVLMQCEQDQCDGVIAAYRDRVLPLARSALGYRGLYLLADRASGRAIALSLWDTTEDAAVFERSGATKAQLAGSDGSVVKLARAEVYQVSVQA